jgi:5-methyltetrahydropteroyltriglutamate--homocysteine methyltransferase
VGVGELGRGAVEDADEAARFVPLEQLALSGQCGFSSTVEGNSLTRDEQVAKLELNVQTAEEVWG